MSGFLTERLIEDVYPVLFTLYGIYTHKPDRSPSFASRDSSHCGPAFPSSLYWQRLTVLSARTDVALLSHFDIPR